jgi:predicted metal-dependent phosphoesterase TrpH
MLDLQSPSTVSDGELPPAGVVEAAAAAGVTTLALTDHDAIDGLAEADRTAREVGIALVPAAEMSCVHEAIDDLHMLGYWIEPSAMAPACERAQSERRERAEEIVANLQAAGFELTMDDVVREAGDADSIGRPHIAKAAGATKETMNAFFEEWLVPNGGRAFVSRKWPNALEAVELIHGAGGAAVLAHPFWDIEEPNEVMALIDDLDLDGVETFYPSHTRDQTKFLLDVCADRNLAATGSSDFHGPSHKIFSRFGAYPTYELGEPELPPTPAA